MNSLFGLRPCLEDDPCSDNQKTVQHWKSSISSKVVGVSDEQTFHILSEELATKKLSTRWVTRLITIIKDAFKCNFFCCLHRFKKNTTNYFAQVCNYES
jgi:hypothetical protein